MAITGGIGRSKVHENRRFEDYKSLKQHFQHNRRVDEVFISGRTTTDGNLTEINFCIGDTINYIAAEGQAYIRTEQDDVGIQGEKFVYLQYQDDTGAILPWVTADMNDTNTTTEVVIGSTDFFRARQMYCEIISSANDAVLLTDANMGGVDDIFAFINDGGSVFNLERFFTQPSATVDSYLAKIHVHSIPVGIGAATDTFIVEITYTPRAPSAGGETGAAAAISEVFKFEREFDWQPCILLQGGTEVIFKVNDIATANVIHIEAVMVEIYPDAR